MPLQRTQYDRTIQVPFSWVSPLSGVEEKTAGIGWYRRTVQYAACGRLFLCFGVREITCANVDGRDYQWILLNGKPIYLPGTLDQAFNPKGHFT